MVNTTHDGMMKCSRVTSMVNKGHGGGKVVERKGKTDVEKAMGKFMLKRNNRSE